MKKVNTLLYAAFPGTGKSFYTKYKKCWDERIWDSDSSKFDKTKFPNNYIEHIKEGSGFANIIFISSHKEVRDALVENNIPFTLIYPDISLKQEYIERYKGRDNDDNFIKLLDFNWDLWITECQLQKGCDHIVLKSGEYISNIIK